MSPSGFDSWPVHITMLFSFQHNGDEDGFDERMFCSTLLSISLTAALARF